MHLGKREPRAMAGHYDRDPENRAKAGNPRSVLLVGTFLTVAQGSQNVCVDLANRLANAGWVVFTTSRQPGRLGRLLDMVATAWRHRHQYAVAQVDLYSG